MADHESNKTAETVLNDEVCMNCEDIISSLMKLRQKDLVSSQEQEYRQMIIRQTENDKDEGCRLCDYFVCLSVYSNHRSDHGVRAWFWQDKSQRPILYGLLILRQPNGSILNETVPIEIRHANCTGVHDKLSLGQQDT